MSAVRDGFVVLGIGVIFGVAACLSQWPDQPGDLIIDDATGCHYIIGPTGGVTPRMTAPLPGQAMGWHLCSGEPGGDDAAWEDGGEPWAGKDGEVVP